MKKLYHLVEVDKENGKPMAYPFATYKSKKSALKAIEHRVDNYGIGTQYYVVDDYWHIVGATSAYFLEKAKQNGSRISDEFISY